MFRLRLMLLVLTLGLAALIGWLHHSPAPLASVAAGGPIVDSRPVPPPHTAPLQRHSKRGRAAPDPTPDDFEPVVVLDDAEDDQDGDHDDASAWTAWPSAAGSRAAETHRFATAASSRPGHTPLFLILGRFRC